jgi:gluconokinase
MTGLRELSARPPDRSTTTIVVMGVTGSGKSTVMHALAERLRWPSADGDTFHSAANIAKMHAGHPLTDADRRPWLAAIATWIGEQEAAGHDAVVACSALRRAYRDVLRDGHPSVWFAHLAPPRAVAEEHLRARTGHFMPASLLDSQLATLEPLAPDEPGMVITAVATTDAVDEILRQLGRSAAQSAQRR